MEANGSPGAGKVRLHAQAAMASTALSCPFIPSEHTHQHGRKLTSALISTLQLASRGLAELNHQLPELLPVLHILENLIDRRNVLQISLQNPRDDWMDLVRLDELDHLPELLARAHRTAPDINIL